MRRSVIPMASIALVLMPIAPVLGTTGVTLDPTPVDCVVPLVDDKCEKWARRYTRGFATAGALAPSGGRAFSVGSVSDNPNGTYRTEMQTVAYDVASGNRLWVAREAGPTDDWTMLGRNVVISPDEKVVYAFATVFQGPGSAKDKLRNLVVAAYDAATGARLWRKTYDGPAKAQDDAWAAAVSPDGDHLYVAAAATGSNLPVATTGGGVSLGRAVNTGGLEVDVDLALLTFDTATGDLLDETIYGGPSYTIDGVTHGSWDVPLDLFVSRDGRRIVVAGISSGRETYRQNRRPHSFVGVWRAADERDEGLTTEWVEEIPGSPLATALVESQGTIGFAGYARPDGGQYRPYSVAGLSLADGSLRWQTPVELGGSVNDLEYPRGLLVDEERGRLYVPGLSRNAAVNEGTTSVLALSASDGALVWRKRLRDPRSEATIIFNYDSDVRPMAALDPASGHVQLTMLREGRLAALSLDHATGAQRWASVFDHPVGGTELPERASNFPFEIEAAGGTAVIFGESYMTSPLQAARSDLLTIAYEV